MLALRAAIRRLRRHGGSGGSSGGVVRGGGAARHEMGMTLPGGPLLQLLCDLCDVQAGATHVSLPVAIAKAASIALLSVLPEGGDSVAMTTSGGGGGSGSGGRSDGGDDVDAVVFCAAGTAAGAIAPSTAAVDVGRQRLLPVLLRHPHARSLTDMGLEVALQAALDAVASARGDSGSGGGGSGGGGSTAGGSRDPDAASGAAPALDGDTGLNALADAPAICVLSAADSGRIAVHAASAVATDVAAAAAGGVTGLPLDAAHVAAAPAAFRRLAAAPIVISVLSVSDVAPAAGAAASAAGSTPAPACNVTLHVSVDAAVLPLPLVAAFLRELNVLLLAPARLDAMQVLLAGAPAI